MLLLLPRVHWQKLANQTCVSRLTKKLMASHLSRRARKTLTVKASDHWQKMANQTCVSKLTNKLMASHLSRRATAPDRLLVEVFLMDPVRGREMLLLLPRVHWQKLANQTCVSRLTKKLMASHLSRRARKTLTVKASDHWQKMANQTCVSKLTNKLMASHLSRRATAPDRLLVEVFLMDPVRGREMLLLLPRVHWQKMANQTCVLRLTKKLMASHLSRRAGKPLTVKASDTVFRVKRMEHQTWGTLWTRHRQPWTLLCH